MPGVALVLFFAGVLIPRLWPSSATLGMDTVASDPAQMSAGGSSNGVPTMQIGLPIYFMNMQNHLFYREVNDLPTQQDALVTAVNAVLNVAPNTPGYASVWKGGSVLSVQQRGSSVLVDLSPDAYAVFTDIATARNAAAQMYYTINAVLGTLDTPQTVVLLSNGRADVPQLGNTGTPGFWDNVPLAGPMWFDHPVNGGVVQSGGIVFSGHVVEQSTPPILVVVDAKTGDPVTSVTVEFGKGRGYQLTWFHLVDLEPGRYQATISGSGPSDTIAFTVH